MNGQQLLNYVALAQGGGSLFMFLGGVLGNFDAFLLIGNALSVLAGSVWAYTIHSMGMNQRTMYIFATLAVLNVVGLAVQAVRCRSSKGGNESDDEDEAEEPARLDDAPKQAKQSAKLTASLRKRRKKASPNRDAWADK